MSQMRFCYDDIITDSTVITFNSEETLLPVENIGNEILAKKYRTKTGFIIKDGYNDAFRFYESAGSSTVTDFALSATTFTGSGLASAIQTAMRANGKFSTQTVSYNSSTERFTITKASTATTMALRFDNLDMSISEIMGYIKKDYASASTFISAPTKGNQQWVELRKENLSGSVFILHKHNFSSGTVLKLRAQATSTYFYGLNQYGRGDGIFQEFENLILDNTDLRESGPNWTSVNSGTGSLSTLSINGNLFTKVTNGAAQAGYVSQIKTSTFTNTILTGSVILKKGSSVGNTTTFQIYNNTTSGFLFNISPDWDNFGSSPATPSVGTLLDYKWYDSETLKLYFECAEITGPMALTDDIGPLCYGSNNATAGEYTYWTEVQLIDHNKITMFPFVDGIHSADVIDVEQTMPDKFIVRLKIEPRFAFDGGTSKRFVVWRVDATHQILLYYEGTVNNKFFVFWLDGGTGRTLESYELDDGDSLTNLNQKWDIIVFLNLSSGVQTDSMFIVIPQESGSIFIDNSWSGIPNTKSSTFSTLSIGNTLGIEQADSDIELLQVFEWDRDKPTITSSEDVDDYLSDKTRLLNLDYKHTDYMRFLGTSTTFGQFEQEITINANPNVTLLDETLQGNVIQLSWADIKKSYSEIGRAFLSPVFYPANHPDNKISWFKKKILRRTKKTMAESGATYFDKKDPVDQYTLIPDPLNEYRNPNTKTGMETFLDTVGDFQSFYVILDSDLSNTVYGFLPSNSTDYNRLKNTPTIIIPPMVLQEQK